MSRYPRRWISSVSLALAVILLCLVDAPSAHAGTPEVILGRPRVGEFQPVRGSGWLAWQQNTRKRPRHYDVIARSVDTGSQTRVNPPGTNGANGDIEGDRLVYQQFERGRSGLRFFDLSTGERSKPPSGINTEHWEYWPSTVRAMAALRSSSGEHHETHHPVRPVDRRGETTRQDTGSEQIPRAGPSERGVGGLVPVSFEVRVQHRPVPHPDRRVGNDRQPGPPSVPRAFGRSRGDGVLRAGAERMWQPREADPRTSRWVPRGVVAPPERGRHRKDSRSGEAPRKHDPVRPLQLRAGRRVRCLADRRLADRPSQHGYSMVSKVETISSTKGRTSSGSDLNGTTMVME